MTPSRSLASAFAALFALAACAGEPTAPTSTLAVTVAPLSYPGVTNASYDLEVRNASGDLVFSRSIDSLGYGGGDGSASYIGPCDADTGENPNEVSLTLTGLYAGAGGATEIPASDYMNPGTLTREATCLPNADVAVTFDLTIARRAQQGFFDIAVAFSDVYCSAKLDCVDQDDQPLMLLHDADGARARTVVLGLACTADIASGGETWLYRDPVVVTCDGGTATVDPSAGPGNLTEGAGITSTGTAPLFGAAVYRGGEQLGFNKRYWNVLLGLNPTAAGCTVTTTATASPDELTGGGTPAGTSWPYIDWDVELTAPTSAALSCTTHPIDGEDPNDGVSTLYTGLDTPETFAATFGPSLPTQPDPLAPCTVGQTDCAFRSCRAIYDAGAGDTDDFYVIDPDGPDAGEVAFEVWCGMALPLGGWTLVGHYYSTGGSALPVGAAVGTAPVTVDGTTSQVLADATIAAFGAATYLVQSGTSHTRNPSCDTYYQLATPGTWSTSTNYTSVRCSLDLTDWGAYFDPTGISLNTQSGGGNWELNYCRSSGGSQGTTSQWVYNGYSGVQGDDLCANGGGPNDADKWLWVRETGALCSPGQTDCALASCADVYAATLTTTDGTYAIDPDGPDTGTAAFDAYCLMSTPTPGWTLVARVYGPGAYGFGYSDWTSFTTLGTPSNLNVTTLDDTVFPTYGTVAGDALLFYDGTAVCGSDRRLLETADVLGGVTLKTFLTDLPTGGCGDDYCSSLPTANRVTVTYKNTGCTQPFNPTGGAGYVLPSGELGVNLNHGPGYTRFAVQSPSWDSGIGGVNPADGSYATGDLDIQGDGISQWSGHVVSIFVR